MSVRPLKRTGFAQGLYQQSSSIKEALGTMRITRDGRIFRYARAGATALVAGRCGVAPAIAADVMNEACANTHAIGDLQFTETITSAAAAYSENHFRGGFLQINDGTGVSHQYLIDSSTAVALGGTSITLGLAEAIRVALVVTTSEFTLAKSPWQGVAVSATEENLPVGIAPIPVTATYYYWAQTHGPALVVVSGTPAVGTVLVLDDAVPGNLKAIASPLDIDIVYQAGIAWGTVGVDTKSKPVFLTID
jgi:hypothetical protein